MAALKRLQWSVDIAAPASRVYQIPSPAELQTDINALESWVGEVRKRRG